MSESADIPANDGSGYRYWAFISYSHRDGAAAKRLHSKLETWAVPSKLVGRATLFGKLPRRLFPIFLDRDEISGGESLDEVIRAALKLSRYLIVICSPQAAASKYVNEEIRLFKELGRGARIVYLIVAGDPAGGDSTDRQSGGCFPVAALYPVGADGVRGSERVEPIAADARPGKDGWRDARLKILARLLQVGFDELKLREARRRRQRRAIRSTLLAGGVALLAAAYIAAADAGLHLPLCERLRSWLDGRELSVFRHVPDAAGIRASADTLAARLDDALTKRRRPSGWFAGMANSGDADLSCMTQAQILAALASMPGGTNSDPVRSSAVIDSFDVLFREGVPVIREGIKLGWRGSPETGTLESHTALWTAIALGKALGKPSVNADAAIRARFLDRLKFTQESLGLYHRGADAGAWDAFPFQVNSRQHSVYASTLALMGLVQARCAKLPWEGSVERRDELLRQTAAWLIGEYQSTGPVHGWINDPREEHVSDVYDGLTAQTYAALLKAEETDPAVSLPASMGDDIRFYLVNCGTRTSDYAVDAGQFSVECRKTDSSTEMLGDSVRYLWWPWVIHCADLWLRHAQRHHLPREQQVQVRRTLAHLIIDLGPGESEKAMRGYSYLMAEELYSLRSLQESE